MRLVGGGGGGISWFMFLVLFTCFSLYQMKLSMGDGPPPAAEMVPLVEEGKAEMVVVVGVEERRRKLESFQICSLCTCCGGGGGGGGGESRSYCLPSPCCYAINCNIPNRPFGFCSFTPKTCNCFGCHI
ncbi:PREDICTED: uncharacterized protein LOC105955414 [Erythranthe guttata]|uniref:uncharacterized protein LOC105955414 n=1 Tax=Erythranthe guttata TaxID=4155 RepID=UPI00064DDD36|nr:PREDICTED: uncharacterized protein LOC105955414 [Erythranthe guttata]|eukprot:XP_012834583.1 PREDICTED: uncharacterized protein LOC105955414 [Erythranthe guttata]